MLQFTKNQIRAIRDYIKNMDSDRVTFRCLHGVESGHYLTSGQSLIQLDHKKDDEIYPPEIFSDSYKVMKKNTVAYIGETGAQVDIQKLKFNPINEQSPQFDKVYPEKPIQYKAEFSIENLKHVIDFLDRYTDESIIKLQFHGGLRAVGFSCGKISGLIMPSVD